MMDNIYLEDEKFRIVSYVKAIDRIRPKAKFSIVEGDLSSLDWQDEKYPRPSNDEIMEEYARLENYYLQTKYQILRKHEYPDFHRYLDGIVKGDQLQIKEYTDACLNVKLKYPKPEPSKMNLSDEDANNV